MDRYPVTPAVRFLREQKIAFDPHVYKYEEHGGTARSAAELGVPEHQVIKTLVMETESGKPLVVLMHGDLEVSTRELARATGTKSITPCDPAAVQKLTGYMVGGCSPFGMRKSMPVYVESTILELPLIYINGGKRGFLVSISPAGLRSTLHPIEVSVAVKPR
jgi:Cys-tRNA(Pro) deacylase